MQCGFPPQKPGGAIRQSHLDTVDTHSKGKRKDGVTLTTASMLLGGHEKSMQCERGYVTSQRQGLCLHVVGGAMSPLCGRGGHTVWEGLRLMLWAGLCHAELERSHSVLWEGPHPNSVGGVTSHSMRGAASRLVGGATPTQRGRALSGSVGGFVTQYGRRCVTHCGQAGHVHGMWEGLRRHRVGQVSFWADRKFWN